MDIIPLERFQEELTESLNDLRKPTGQDYWSDLLAHWVASHFLNLGDVEMRQACGMQGAGEEGIDLFWVETGGRRVIIGQAEAGNDLNLKRAFSRRIIDKLRKALAALNDTELAANRLSPIATSIDQYMAGVEKGFTVEFWAIIGGNEDAGLEKACRRFQRIDLKNYPKHTLRVINAASLLTQYCANIAKLPYPDVEFKVPKGEHFQHGENSLLVTISGESVQKAVREKGLHIFETNARLPLLRSEINREIAATVTDKEGRRNFWNFNNGMTMLCEDFQFVGENLKLTGAQIVNGCQTASTLSKHQGHLDGVEVMCRVIRKAPAMLSDKIRRATNLQNQILARDLRSGDLVQKSLQSAFRNKGYFYERKRDEFKNCIAELGKANITSQFSKGNLDNLYLAKLALAFWHEKPAPAKMEKGKIFVKSNSIEEEDLPEGFYDIVFHDGVCCEELLFAYLVSNYLYEKFAVGYRPTGARRTRGYMMRTHGDLTVLGFVGKLIRQKYSLDLPIKGQKLQILKVMLVPRFENPSEQPEFFNAFNRVFGKLWKGLEAWIARAEKRQRRDIGAVDLRKIFIAGSTFEEILHDKAMKSTLRKAQKLLPELN